MTTLPKELLEQLLEPRKKLDTLAEERKTTKTKACYYGNGEHSENNLLKRN